mmetsp:Transcript_147460/g.410784  ORF Transcript_147460/g.410784 Transcript_147460/m.410784 type:complete len:114 (+) Transcript_147460:542-883(+)
MATMGAALAVAVRQLVRPTKPTPWLWSGESSAHGLTMDFGEPLLAGKATNDAAETRGESGDTRNTHISPASTLATTIKRPLGRACSGRRAERTRTAGWERGILQIDGDISRRS